MIFDNKKLQACKPDSVSRRSRTAIIYLSRKLLRGINLPTLYPARREAGFGRAALKGYYTWHFSMQGLPDDDVSINSCELLPHIFTLACRSFSEGNFATAIITASAVIFCGTVSPRWGPALHRCIALCCPDFPPPTGAGSDNPACSSTKISCLVISSERIKRRSL